MASKRLLALSLALWLSMAQASPTDPAINLDFNQVPVKDLLLNLARFSHQNVLIDPHIDGQMSVHIDHLPWSDVLQSIAQAQNLSIQRIHAVTYIEPMSARQTFEQNQTVQQQRIALAYTKADEVLAILKSESQLLSNRGSIRADLRTNSLLIEDIPVQLAKVRQMINALDIEAPQIRIEARLVTIDIHHERDLGLRFGLSSSHHLSGTLAGANQAQLNSISQVPVEQRLNFNMPAQTSTGSAASMGLAMASLADGYYLDLELSALEAQGIGKIIASPNLMVINQQTATIEAGEEVPYQEKTSSGATNVAFKKAVLSLQVTPQIIHQQQILLTLKINQDRVSDIEVNGVPAIDTREITTQILAGNRQTIVLGGIYETDNQHATQRIPFISDLPWIGQLFTHQHDLFQKRELLIFIRPTLVMP